MDLGGALVSSHNHESDCQPTDFLQMAAATFETTDLAPESSISSRQTEEGASRKASGGTTEDDGVRVSESAIDDDEGAVAFTRLHDPPPPRAVSAATSEPSSRTLDENMILRLQTDRDSKKTLCTHCSS